MDWKAVGKLVLGQVPIVGNLLSHNSGAAMALVANALGVGREPDQVAEAIKNDPDAFVKLKQVEAAHDEELKRLTLESEMAYLADIQSARTREVDIAKYTGGKDLNLYILAWVTVIGFFASFGIFTFVGVKNENSVALSLMIGALVSRFGSVYDYFFGSSKGSSDKNKILTAGNKEG